MSEDERETQEDRCQWHQRGERVGPIEYEEADEGDSYHRQTDQDCVKLCNGVADVLLRNVSIIRGSGSYH